MTVHVASAHPVGLTLKLFASMINRWRLYLASIFWVDARRFSAPKSFKKGIIIGVLLTPQYGGAVEFKKSNPDERYQVVNNIPVVTLGNVSFSIYEFHPETEWSEPTNQADEKNMDLVKLREKLILGDPVNEEEVIKVLTIYYKNVAFDPDSVVIKNLMMGEHKIYTWCSIRLFRKCSSFFGTAGTRIDYDINGKNREGGSTGFIHSVVFMRKFFDPVASAATSLYMTPSEEN